MFRFIDLNKLVAFTGRESCLKDSEKPAGTPLYQRRSTTRRIKYLGIDLPKETKVRGFFFFPFPENKEDKENSEQA